MFLVLIPVHRVLFCIATYTVNLPLRFRIVSYTVSLLFRSRTVYFVFLAPYLCSYVCNIFAFALLSASYVFYPAYCNSIIP